MKPLLLLTAVTSRQRNAVMAFVYESIHALGGWVDDVNLYSNMMAAIRFTLKENRLSAFVSQLAGWGVAVDKGVDFSDCSPDAQAAERACSLQISFLHNEPDLKRDVLAVPGY